MTVTRARSLALGALTIEVAVLAITGAILYVAYVPTAAQAFGPGFPDAEGGELAEFLRLVHRGAAWLAAATAVTGAALLAVRSHPTERTTRGRAVGAGMVLAVATATYTGFLLPWDQIALSVVTVVGNLSGYTWLRDDEILFVLVNGRQVAASTLLKWLVLHIVVLGGAVAALLCLAWRQALATPVDHPALVESPAELSSGP